MRRFFAITLFVFGFLLLRMGTAQAATFTGFTLGASPAAGTSAAAAGYGTSVTFTVTPTGAQPTAGSGVTFYACPGTVFGPPPYGLGSFSGSGCTSIGTATYAGTSPFAAVATAPAPGTLSAVPVGTQNVYAFDTTNVFNSGPATATTAYFVTKATTTTTLASSVNPSQVGTGMTTLTATIAATTGALVGSDALTSATVAFSDGGTSITCGATSTTAPGTFMCSGVTFSTSGPHNLTAVYSGNTNYGGSTGTLTQNGTAFGSAVSVASTPNPSNLNDNVTIQATVTTTNNAFASSTNPGTVTITDTFNGQTTVLTTATLIANNAGTAATASYATTTLASGSHSIIASYSGDTQHAAAQSSPITQIVGQAGAVVLTFTSSANPSVLGQSVTLTANLSSTNPNGLSGTVTFADGANVINTATVSGNSASFTTTQLATGIHSLTATYSGDASSSGAMGTLTQTVNKANSSIAITSSSNPSSSGSATFSVTVTDVAPGTGVGTGTVTFTDGATTLGTATLDNTGKGSINATNLSNGSHTITATYGGDTRTAGSTATLTESVNITASVATVTLSATPNPAEANTAVTITANVAVPTGVPTGSITVSANNSQIGTATLDANGNASFTTTTLPIGTTEIEVSFDGAGFYPSGSGTISVTVYAHPTGGETDGGTTTTSSSSSSSSTSSSGSAADAGTTKPTSTVTVGSEDSGCSTSSSNPLSGIAAFALGMLGLALIRRRRAA